MSVLCASRASRPRAPLASTERRLNSALRPVLLAFALGAVASAGLPAFAADATPLDASATRAYDIPPGPLGRTLSVFAAGSGIALSFAPALTEGLASPALSGRYTPREAAERLLAGSGLQLSARNDGSYTLRRRDITAPAAPASPSGAVTLSAVTVTADADRSGTTEGTGSYTTRATAAATGLALSLATRRSRSACSRASRSTTRRCCR